jgi:hypothetical protein
MESRNPVISISRGKFSFSMTIILLHTRPNLYQNKHPTLCRNPVPNLIKTYSFECANGFAYRMPKTPYLGKYSIITDLKLFKDHWEAPTFKQRNEFFSPSK